MLAAAFGGAPAAGAPSCFGAAARSPVNPCFNPTRSFTPSVKRVDEVPSSACKLTDEQPAPVCTFGVPASKATDTVALVGDSHALHWRAAVDVVAKRNRWRAYSVTAPGCFYSDAVDALPTGAREPCTAWYADARGWFVNHPEVSTVFVSQHAPTPVVVAPGETMLSVKTAGFRKAWSELPQSVKHVVVIRDTPDPRDDTLDCVERVRTASSGRPGPLCATRRSDAIRLDSAVTTVAQLHSSRYRAIDMTSFFCSARDCYPVVGGLLVFRDVFGHITVPYSTSLGPYLARKVRALHLG